MAYRYADKEIKYSDEERTLLLLLETREETFRGRWNPEITIKPAELAMSGFYYVGPNDRVRCIYCRGSLEDWKHCKSALYQHKLFYPTCPGHQMTKIKGLDDSLLKGSVEYREATYNDPNWLAHKEHPLTGKELAADGFYYTGPGDRVCCAFCQGSSTNWKHDILPIVTHKLYYKNCMESLSKNLKSDTSFLNDPPTAKFTTLMAAAGPPDPTAVKEGRFYVGVGKTVDKFHCSLISPDTITPPETARVFTDEEPIRALMTNPEADNMVFYMNVKTLKELVDSETKPIEKDIKAHQDKYICKVCLQNESEILFIPCNHMSCCYDCAKLLTNCPICRHLVLAVVKTYFV